MNVKKINKNCIEITTKENLIYLQKEKNPSTTNLFLYVVDVFEENEKDIVDGDVFDDLYEATFFLKTNYNIDYNCEKTIGDIING
jgi:hypothetical protein